MRLFALFLCSLVLGASLIAADPSPEPAEDNDAKTILGTWQAVKGIKQGMPVTAAELEKLQMKVTKDKLTILEQREKGPHEESVRYTLDMKMKPRGLDVTLDLGKKDTIKGIYKIEKGELTILFPEPGGARPKSFDEKTRTMLVFRKAKATK